MFEVLPQGREQSYSLLFSRPERGSSVKITGRQLWPRIIIAMCVHVEKLQDVWVHAWHSILI